MSSTTFRAARYYGVRDARSWVIAVAAGIGAYVAASHSLFFSASAWEIAAFVGCVVGLAAAAPVQAGVCAPLVMVVGMALLAPTLAHVGGVGAAGYALAGTLALCSSVAVSLVRGRVGLPARERVDVAMSVVLVLWVLIGFWSPLFRLGPLGTGYGTLPAAKVTEVPQPGGYVNDDAIYRRVYYLMHRGEPYYASFRDAWLGLSSKPPLPNVVTGYRLPTFFWLWRALPPDPFWIVYLFLALCSAGIVAAAFIAGQLAGARFAPLAAVALAAYATGVGATEYVTYVDLPAACLSLAGVALFVRASFTQRRSTLWAAAGAVLLAALTREILAYLIVLAALSALLECTGTRVRAAAPWLVALGVFALGYIAHSFAAWPYLSVTGGRLSYLKGSVGFVVDGLTRFSGAFNGQGVALVILFVLGVVGAIATSSRLGWSFSAFAVAALVLPMLAMVRIGNPGIQANGQQVNYWGMLVVPLALALWPACALLLQLDFEP